MATEPKTITTTIKMRNMIKVPQVVIEERGLASGSTLCVSYGKNYTAIVILPEGIKINDRMQERINILVNEPLS
jgi:hypothetical protein